jgi:hypothetical protein
MDSSDRLISLLKRCTVRLSTPSTCGTGFFVAPGLILTCAHVVGNIQNNQTAIEVIWGDQTYHAKILRSLPSYPDLALLKSEDVPATHPCVFLQEAVKERDEVYSYGYTKDYPQGEPATFEVEGETGDPVKLLTFKLGQAKEGFSGAPIYNFRTGCVCGVMSITKGQNTLLGGRGIPTSVVLEGFEELMTLQKEFHNKERRWYDLLPESEAKPFSWQELRATCSKITEETYKATVKDEFHEELYLQRDRVHQTFMRFLEDSTKRGFVLVGGSGVGKSSFLLAAHEELQFREDVCVLIYDAASLIERPLDEILNEHFQRWGPPRIEWTTQKLWKKIDDIDGIDKRRFLFFIDALNEQEREQAKALLKQLDKLISSWSWLKVVIVSRPEAWQFIKSGVKLPESRYYQRDGGTLGGSFNYSERLEPFSRHELPMVYEKYRQRYQVQTSYEDLSPRLRDIMSDPFQLQLVTRIYQVISEDLKISTLIGDYVEALVKQNKLQRGDALWLEKQFVPLMASEGHYENVVTSKELYAADQALLYAVLDRAEKSGLPQLQRYIHLVDAGILKQKSDRDGFEISFKSERYYDHFISRRLFDISKDQADRYDYFLNMIGRTIKHPYLWGAVRNALVHEAEQTGIEIVLKICRTKDQRIPDQHIREMMINVLTTRSVDARWQVERILKELVPAVRQAGVIKKLRQWQGKVPIDDDLLKVPERIAALRNAGRIATEVASNLNMPWLLQTAALQEDSTIRTEAIRFAYRLWKHNHQEGFSILEHLTQEITSGLIPEKATLESTIGLSMSILFDSAKDEQALGKLQGFWHDIIARMLAGEQGKLWERLLRRLFFPPERILSTVINLVIGYIERLPDYGEAFNYPDLAAFFDLALDADERTLYTRLVSYIDVEGDYSRVQMEQDYLTVMRQTNNYFIVFMVQLGLIAHACQAPLDFLPFLQKFYEEAKKDVVAYPYMNDVIHVLDNVLHQGPMDDALFNFFVLAVEECQEFYRRHPEAIRNRNYRATPEVHDLGPYIFHLYRKTGTVNSAWLEMRIQAALAREDTRFFELLLRSELSLIGIERQSPKAALLTVALFFQQGNADIRSRTQEFLAHLRAYYPNEVDEFLEEQGADNDFREQVQRHEPEETIAALIGQKSLYFLRDDIIMQSPKLRSRLMSQLAKAADSRNIRVWLDDFLRELINVMYGGEILPLSG